MSTYQLSKQFFYKFIKGIRAMAHVMFLRGFYFSECLGHSVRNKHRIVAKAAITTWGPCDGAENFAFEQFVMPIGPRETKGCNKTSPLTVWGHVLLCPKPWTWLNQNLAHLASRPNPHCKHRGAPSSAATLNPLSSDKAGKPFEPSQPRNAP